MYFMLYYIVLYIMLNYILNDILSDIILQQRFINVKFRIKGGIFVPKMKTHKGIAKRIKKTGTGKLMRKKGFKSHLLTKKSSNRKHRLRKEVEVSKAHRQKYRQLVQSM